MNPEILLSEKFAEFSTQIVALHEKKKELQTEIRRLVDEHKAAMKDLDETASDLNNVFEAWQAEQVKK